MEGDTRLLIICYLVLVNYSFYATANDNSNEFSHWRLLKELHNAKSEVTRLLSQPSDKSERDCEQAMRHIHEEERGDVCNMDGYFRHVDSSDGFRDAVDAMCTTCDYQDMVRDLQFALENGDCSGEEDVYMHTRNTVNTYQYFCFQDSRDRYCMVEMNMEFGDRIQPTQRFMERWCANSCTQALRTFIYNEIPCYHHAQRYALACVQDLDSGEFCTARVTSLGVEFLPEYMSNPWERDEDGEGEEQPPDSDG
eukprot:783714_1